MLYICVYLYYIYIYLHLSLSVSTYIYIVIVCDHEITHISYAICPDKIKIKLYGLFCG